MDENTLYYISNLKNIRIVFCISYSGLSKEYEPSSSRNIEETFKKVKKAGFKIIHFWRPIIDGINSNSNDIKNVLDLVSQYCSSSVCVGLKISRRTINETEKNLGFKLPSDLLKEEESTIYFPSEIQQSIIEIAKDKSPKYPVFMNLTSCSISYSLKIPDYLANNIVYAERCKISNCPDDQRQRCSSIRKPSISEVEFCLENLDKGKVQCVINDDHIFLQDTFSKEEVLYIYHRLNFPVRAKEIISSSVWQNNSISPRE